MISDLFSENGIAVSGHGAHGQWVLIPYFMPSETQRSQRDATCVPPIQTPLPYSLTNPLPHNASVGTLTASLLFVISLDLAFTLFLSTHSRSLYSLVRKVLLLPKRFLFFSCSSSSNHDAMRLVLRATSGSANEIQSQITTSYTCGDGFGGHPPHWRAGAGYRVTNCDRTVSTECRLSGPRTAPSGVEGKGKREKKVGYQSAGGVPTWADIARGGGAGYTEPKARLPAEKGRSHKSNSDPILL
jgi:hypothetical protein